MESAFKQIRVLYIIFALSTDSLTLQLHSLIFLFQPLPPTPPPPPLVLPETRVNDRLPQPVWQSGENNIFGTIRNRWKTIGTIQTPNHCQPP
jgi:hypothetical protein